MGTPIGDEPAGNQNLPAKSDPGVSSIHYLYEAKIKNTGVKTIRAIVWEYSLFDPETNVEVGRHRFSGKTTVRSGKTVNLIGRSTKPPTGIVEVTKSGVRSRITYHERIVIHGLSTTTAHFGARFKLDCTVPSTIFPAT